MALNITVGILKKLKTIKDNKRFKYFHSAMNTLNQVLQSEGLALYMEPTNFNGEPWSVKTDYLSIHYLRRFAAHIALTGAVPEPTRGDPVQDQCYCEYLNTLGVTAIKYRFDHLIFHSDYEGFYVPVDFDEVLFPEERLKIAGDMIGSSYRLRDECLLLLQYLEAPLDIDPRPDKVESAFRDRIQNLTWHRYLIEAYICLLLYHASRKSIELGSAIVFH